MGSNPVMGYLVQTYSSCCFAMAPFQIEYQNQFGQWQRFTTKHNEGEAYRSAQARARSTGKRHRLVDADGRLLDVIEP